MITLNKPITRDFETCQNHILQPVDRSITGFFFFFPKLSLSLWDLGVQTLISLDQGHPRNLFQVIVLVPSCTNHMLICEGAGWHKA